MFKAMVLLKTVIVLQVCQWILSHEWTVGDLWNMLVEYSSQRFNKETDLGFFAWLLPPYLPTMPRGQI